MARQLTRRERIQWIILGVLVVSLVIIVIWNIMQPDTSSGGVAVFDEVLRRKRGQ